MVEPRWCGWWRGHRRHAERRISSSSGGDGHGLRLGVRISVGIVASEVRGRSGGGGGWRAVGLRPPQSNRGGTHDGPRARSCVTYCALGRSKLIQPLTDAKQYM
jgi:hypothetical protein